MKTVTLKTPIDGHRGKVTEIKLREPTLAEFIRFDEPYTLAQTPGGGFVPVVNGEALRGYIEACVVEPDALVLMQASLADARAIKEAMLDFFRAAASAAEPSPTLPTISSSPASSAPASTFKA